MTNGEIIQSMFPNMNFGTLAQDDVIVNRDYSNNDEPQVFIPKRVWNAEYKEPTTENGISNKSIIYKAKESKEIQEDLNKLSKLNEPITKNDLGVDCISREAVERIINKWLSHSDYELKDHIYSMTEKIHNLPSVTPIRPKGHWIWELDETPSTPISSYELNYAGWVCSCCHEFPDDICEWDNPDEPPTYKFCPNCGADNREVEE